MIVRQFVQVPHGIIHCASAGRGRPVLLLHQTPRSWDEYRDVLPLLGAHRRAIAIDTIGFGDSGKPPAGGDSIESWASTVVDVMDALGLPRVAVVGHHTGAVIAAELAAGWPGRVEAAVFSAMPLVDAAFRKARQGGPVVDAVERRPDGSHLAELWRMRQPLYPPGDVDLLERFIADAIKAGDCAAEGHRVVARYVMETRLPKIRCPVLLVAPTADPHAMPYVAPLRQAIPHSRVVEIAGGMVPLPDQMPKAFAAAVLAFLAAIDEDGRRPA